MDSYRRISRRATFNLLNREHGGAVEDLEMGGWLNAFVTITDPQHVVWQQVGHGPNEWRVDLVPNRFTSFQAAKVYVQGIRERVCRLLTPPSLQEQAEYEQWVDSLLS